MSVLNISLIVALGLSELLSLIPALHSNGLLDGLIKFLKGVASKDPAA